MCDTTLLLCCENLKVEIRTKMYFEIYFEMFKWEEEQKTEEWERKEGKREKLKKIGKENMEQKFCKWEGRRG